MPFELLENPHFLSRCKELGGRIAIITDSKLAPIYGEQLLSYLSEEGIDATLIPFQAGEASKTRATKEKLENALLGAKFGRQDSLIALGGGVVTDLTGFVAATYCRGIRYLNVPTTLMGMVDAAIGGKTAINTPHGKNLFGAFHLPEDVFIDLSLLDTLGEGEMRQGAAEIIKYGLIKSPSLYKLLKSHVSKWHARDPDFIQMIVQESCKIKTEIVEADLREESGLRKVLNFGHTIAHALETTSGYRLPHGDAVAIGLLAEASLSSGIPVDEIRELLISYHFPLEIDSHITPEMLLEAMELDKKSVAGRPHFTTLARIGEVEHISTLVPKEALNEILKEMTHESAPV